MRIRKNGGFIGAQPQQLPTGISGAYSSQDQYVKSYSPNTIAHTLSNKSQYPTGADPYRQSVVAHFGDTSTPVHVFSDISGNNWDEYTQTTVNGTSPWVTTDGPATQYHCTSFAASDYYQLNDAANLRFGAGAFTIEFWVLPLSTDLRHVISKGAASTGWNVAIDTSAKIQFTYNTTVVTGTKTLTRGAWNHVQIVRTNTAANGMSIYVNGVLDSTFTCAATFSETTALYIGADRVNTAATRLNAYLTDLQVSNIARSPASAVPSVPYSADANTLILLSVKSLTNKLIGTQETTKAGTLYRYTDTPFAETDTTDSCGLFTDRTTSHMVKVYDTQPGNTSLRFAGDFTAECWFYAQEQGTNKNALFSKGTATAGWEAWYYAGGGVANGAVGFIDGTTETVSAANIDICANAWNHFAVVRSGMGAGNVKIYINGVLALTTTVTTSWAGETSPLRIGDTKATVIATITTLGHYGYVSQPRISKIARYTANFTPATTYTADSNTVYMSITKPYSGDFQDSVNLGILRLPLANPNAGQLNMHSSPYQQGWGLTQTSGDGSGFYVVNNTNMQFGTGDFSIELFVSMFDTTTSALPKIILCNRSNLNSDTDPGYAIKVGAYGAVQFITNGNKALLSSTSLIKSQQWTHICIQRRSGVAALYINGNLEHQTLSTESLVPTSDTTICYSALQTSRGLYGKMSNLRINKGTAAYQYNGPKIPVPTSTLSPVTGTVLLTACGPTTKDYASPAVANVLTQKNNPYGIYLNPVSPFPVTKQNADNISNSIFSMYSAGSSNYLKELQNRSHLWMNQGVPFTIEGWLYLPPMNYTTPSAVNVARTTSNTANGWAIIGNNNGSANATGYLAFKIYGTGGTNYIVGTTAAVLNPCSFNHFAIVFDGTKIAIFVNGNSAFVSGAMSMPAINATATTGGLEQFDSTMELKVSRVARYSVAASTIPIPTAPYTSDLSTTALYRVKSSIVDTSFRSRAGRAPTSSSLHTSSTKKKFGNGAFGFRQLDAAAVDRFAWSAGSSWFDHRSMFVRFTDFTVEMWANWSKASAPNANVLCHLYAIKLLSDASGNWRLSYNDTIFLNTTVPIATGSNFDHIAITRMSNNYNLFINGIFRGTLSVNRPATTNNDLEDIQQTYSTDNSLGCDNSATLATRWTGFVQDFRVTAGVARYVPKVIGTINFTSMVHIDSKLPALPTALLPTF